MGRTDRQREEIEGENEKREEQEKGERSSSRGQPPATQRDKR